jgi:hypothetical protein
MTKQEFIELAWLGRKYLDKENCDIREDNRDMKEDYPEIRKPTLEEMEEVERDMRGM